MRIIEQLKLDFKDVLIIPKRSTLNSRSDVILERTFIMPNAKDTSGTPIQWTCIPICASNMDTTGTFEMAKELSKYKLITAIHKHYSLEEWKTFFDSIDSIDSTNNIFNYICISIGVSNEDIIKLQQILDYNYQINVIMVDVANGYTNLFVNQIKKIRLLYPDKILIAGNLVTSEMTEELILNGVDICKIGIGPGSVCTTRHTTGIGYPQLSSIIECADVAHGLGGHIMSDGGCTMPGDIAKAFGGGADFVMLGGMFAGHDETNGTIIETSEGKFKEFYGMSSKQAMDKHHGGVAEYRASEGKSVKIPYKGPVGNTVQTILGGLRSTCTYVGAKYLKELSKRTTFVRVNHPTNEIFSKSK